MKRLFPVLACCIVHAAAASLAAQSTPFSPTAESPAYAPQDVEVRGDGRCISAKPGDIVHYSLTIENLGSAKAVFGELRLRLGRGHDILRGGLPVPDFHSLGGGGVGMRDTNDGKLYHFAFTIPQEIVGGTYRGTQVEVRADEPEPTSPYRPVSQHLPRVEVTRRTRAEVHAYCLNVMSNFGFVSQRPAVTSFAPGPVNPPPAPPTPPKPIPLPQ